MCLLLASSSSAGFSAGEPAAELEMHPLDAPVWVHRTRDENEAVLRLELANRGSRVLRFRNVRWVYLREEVELKRERAGPKFFSGPPVQRDARLEPGQEMHWYGICLEAPPAEADRVRVEMDVRAGGRGRRSWVQSATIPLTPAPAGPLLDLPFTGYWKVSQGHTCASAHRHGGVGGEYSWDFAALGPAGLPVRPEYAVTRANRDSFSFGRPVLAPVTGRVVRVVDGVADNEGLEDYPRRSLLDTLRDPMWIFGNYVVLQAEEGFHVLLAHLKRGSITAREGEAVATGEVIAACGNSGNTVEPHLHIQVMDGADPTAGATRGIPARFRRYREYRLQRDGRRRDLVVRIVEGGDPPLGVVVSPEDAPGETSRR